MSSGTSGSQEEVDDDLAASPVAKTASPISASIARAEAIGAMMLDPTYEPSNMRLRGFGIAPDLHPDIASGEIVSMGKVVLAEGGGSLRTFSGGLAHVCGWWPAWKAKRVQHWEGMPAFYHLVAAECDQLVDRTQAEGIGFGFFLDRKWLGYTADADMWIDGRRHVVEIKRSERDLLKPEYLLKLAAVAEICRRCGWIFRIVLASEIFVNRHHSENCLRFAQRRFANVRPQHIDRLEGFAMREGSDTTYWDLCHVLAPRCQEAGEAVLQALAIRRRIGIDLTRRITPNTPVHIL